MNIDRGVSLRTGACIPHPQNYNRHSDAQLRDLGLSLQKFGQIPAIVVQAGPQLAHSVGPEQYLVVKGHGLLAAAVRLGWSEIVADVLSADYSAEVVAAYLAADNELSRASSPDVLQLAALVEGLREYDAELARLAAGSDERMAELLDMLVTVAERQKDAVDTAGDLAVKWGTALGQLWEIPALDGRQTHRLLIGDCTDAVAVARLFNGRAADCVITDPPYGVDYAEKEAAIRKTLRRKNQRAASDIDNDAGQDYRDFFRRFLEVIPFAPYNTVFVFMSSVELHSLRLAFTDAGLYFSQYLTWVKARRVIGRTDFQWQSEFIATGGISWLLKDAQQLWVHLLAAGLETDAAQVLFELEQAGFPQIEVGDGEWIVYGWRGKHRFYAPRGKRSTVLYADSPSASPYHPTTKPTALLAQLLTAGSRRGHVVYDAFAGSGSLLLACEPLGRAAYMLELSPAYAACILEQAVTELGLTPVLQEGHDGD